MPAPLEPPLDAPAPPPTPTELSRAPPLPLLPCEPDEPSLLGASSEPHDVASGTMASKHAPIRLNVCRIATEPPLSFDRGEPIKMLSLQRASKSLESFELPLADRLEQSRLNGSMPSRHDDGEQGQKRSCQRRLNPHFTGLPAYLLELAVAGDRLDP